MPTLRKTVLSVDDEPDILFVRRLVLESAGFGVLDAANGRSALRTFSANTDVAVVLLDYYMPDLDGGRIAEAMKRARPAVPVIMVSASVQLPVQALSSVDAFIEKGNGPEVLLQKIKELI